MRRGRLELLVFGEDGKSPSTESRKRPADQSVEESAKRREHGVQTEGVQQSSPSLELSLINQCSRYLVPGGMSHLVQLTTSYL